MKHKKLIKKAVRNALYRAKKRKRYWDKKMEEVKK